ncbi:DMT family transporter [Pyrobaculum aerophilum]|uniref:DMT family transporter n=1 Tax=Pyrobaculum aerophilum TaxID=13773 RepID=UPI0023F4FD28|nr:EamA family transporter [Pyrobaculum aerophilum]MCX8135679.1 DMT family transporter [Pyrobaculum aerophilum]
MSLRSPYLRVVGAAALWSTLGVAASIGGNYIWLAFLRSLTAAAIGALYMRRFYSRGLIPGLLLGGLFVAYPVAALYAGVGPAAYLLYTAPLWTTAALAARGERPSAKETVGVSLVLAAVFLMLYASARGELSPIGLLAGLASSAFYGLYIAVARLRAKEGGGADVSYGAMPYTLLVTAPLLLIHVAVNKSPLPLHTALAGLYMGVFGTVIPYRLFSSAVTKIEGARASVIASVEPVLAALWGFLFFKEIPGLLTLTAYALISTAAVVVARK